MSWYIKAVKNYTNFSGRAQRKEFWFFALFNNLICISFLLVDAVTSEVPVLSTLFLLWTVLPSISVTFRRLHDIGRSGWWVLLAFIPILGGLILVWFYALDSQPGTNIYGKNPKGILLDDSLSRPPTRTPNDFGQGTFAAAQDAKDDEAKRLKAQLESKDKSLESLENKVDEIASRLSTLKPPKKKGGCRDALLLGVVLLLFLFALFALIVILGVMSNSSDRVSRSNSQLKRSSGSQMAGSISLQPVDRAGFDRVITEHAGDVVLVDFWASWCMPCRQTFPHTVGLYDKLHDQGLAVVSLSMDQLQDKQKALEFLYQQGATFDNLISSYGPGVEGFHAFGIPDAIPYFTLYDRQGKLRYRFSPLFVDGKDGEPLEAIDARVGQLLNEK